MTRTRLVAFLAASVLMLNQVRSQDFNINDLNLDQRVDDAYRADAAQRAATDKKETEITLEDAEADYRQKSLKIAKQRAALLSLVQIRDQAIYSEEQNAIQTQGVQSESKGQAATQTVVARDRKAVARAQSTLMGLIDEQAKIGANLPLLTKARDEAQTKAANTPSYKNTVILKYNFANLYSYVTKAETRTDGAEVDYNWAVPGDKPDDKPNFHLLPSFSWGYASTNGATNNVANTYAGGLQAYDIITVPSSAHLQIQPSLTFRYKSNNQVKILASGDSDVNAETYEVVPNIIFSIQPSDKWTLQVSPTYSYDYNSMNSRGDTNSGVFALANIDQYTVFDNTTDNPKGEGDKLMLLPQFYYETNTNQKSAVGVPHYYENWAVVGLGINYQASTHWTIRASYLYDAFNSTFEQHRALVEADYAF